MGSLPAYIARRLLVALPTLLVVSFIVFGLQLLLPGDPVLLLAGEDRDPAVMLEDRRRGQPAPRKRLRRGTVPLVQRGILVALPARARRSCGKDVPPHLVHRRGVGALVGRDPRAARAEIGRAHV